MPEGESTAGGAEREQREPSFEEKLQYLVTPQGKEKEPLISNLFLSGIAHLALKPHNRAPSVLENLLKAGNDWYLENLKKELPKDVSDDLAKQWQILGGLLGQEMFSKTAQAAQASEGVKGRDFVGQFAEQLSQLTQGVQDTADATRKMAEATAMIESLPSKPDDQRKVIVKILEEIESNDLPLTDWRNTTKAGILSHAIEHGVIKDQLAHECRARLALQHSFSLVENIPGKGENQPGYLFAAFDSPESRRWALEAEDFNLLLKEGAPGLKIEKAFGILQEAARNGLEIRVKSNGFEKKVVTFNGKGSSRTEQSLLKDEIIKRIGLNEMASRKSLQLAFRLAKATLETSIWNKDMLGNDPVAETIYFKEYREGRATVGRDHGPNITISLVPTFGTSFFRRVLYGEKLKEISKIEDDSRRQKELHSVNREGAIDMSLIDFSKLNPGEYPLYIGVRIPRLLVTKAILLKTTWKPDDFSSDAVESLVAPFRDADPEQAYRLRPLAVLGVIWSVFSNPNEAINNGWDNFGLQAVKKNLTKGYLTETGKLASFLTKDQWTWLVDTLKDDYHLNADHEAAMLGLRRVLAQKFFRG